MKKSLFSLLSFLFLSLGFSFALPSKFEITITPSFKVNEYVDLTIKAVTADGKTDTSYKGQDISIDITDEAGKAITSADVVLPSNGYGFFEASDLWVKIYSKGLALKKPGKYMVSVADVFNTSIKGSTGFVVLGDATTPNMGIIKVTSPTANSTESNPMITIIGSTTNPNTPLSIMIDEKKLKEGVSDSNGGFSIAVSGLTPGSHKLIVNWLDLSNTVIATSGPIPFTIAGQATGEISATLEIQPSKTVKLNSMVKFIITTNPSVTAVTLALGNGTPQPTNKVSDGKFEKEMQMATVGSFPITLEATAGISNKKFPNIDTIMVGDEVRKILSLNGSLESDGSKANLSRTYTGTINFFKLQYGTERNDMKLSLTTTKAEWQILLVEPGKIYYAQVFPIDQAAVVNGDPSQIIELKAKSVCGNGKIETWEECDDGNLSDGDSCSIECKTSFTAPTEPTVPTCNPPSGIKLKTKKIWTQYYLYRWSVPWAQKYMVYRKDSQPSSLSAVWELSLVGETTETQFAYPFDPQASSDQYAWYAVQAVCQDWQQKIVDSIKKVKVGPRETLLVLLLVMSLLMYGFMRQKS
jgi:cysteine-rich repeat protein